MRIYNVSTLISPTDKVSTVSFATEQEAQRFYGACVNSDLYHVSLWSFGGSASDESRVKPVPQLQPVRKPQTR